MSATDLGLGQREGRDSKITTATDLVSGQGVDSELKSATDLGLGQGGTVNARPLQTYYWDRERDSTVELTSATALGLCRMTSSQSRRPSSTMMGTSLLKNCSTTSLAFTLRTCWMLCMLSQIWQQTNMCAFTDLTSNKMRMSSQTWQQAKCVCLHRPDVKQRPKTDKKKRFCVLSLVLETCSEAFCMSLHISEMKRALCPLAELV